MMLALYGVVSGEAVSGGAAFVMNYFRIAFWSNFDDYTTNSKNVSSFVLHNVN